MWKVDLAVFEGTHYKDGLRLDFKLASKTGDLQFISLAQAAFCYGFQLITF